jgi:hypothetical protein
VHSIIEGSLVVTASVVAAVSLLLLVRRRWSARRLKETNDVAGYYSGVVGTIYAVLLAFILQGTWLNFAEAQANVEREANSLVNIFRLAQGLPPELRGRIQGLCRDYAHVMLDIEWDAMEQGGLSPRGVEVNDQLWQAITAVQPRTPSEQLLLDHTLSELARLMEYRRSRHHQIHSQLSPLLWTVLLVGAAITIGFTYLYGVDSRHLHCLKTALLTVLISFILYAIWETGSPLQGHIRVSPATFRVALETFDRLTAAGQ